MYNGAHELRTNDFYPLHKLRPNVKTLFSFSFYADLELSIANYYYR